MKISLSVIQ
jgi:plastocyanin